MRDSFGFYTETYFPVLSTRKSLLGTLAHVHACVWKYVFIVGSFIVMNVLIVFGAHIQYLKTNLNCWMSVSFNRSTPSKSMTSMTLKSARRLPRADKPIVFTAVCPHSFPFFALDMHFEVFLLPWIIKGRCETIVTGRKILYQS